MQKYIEGRTLYVPRGTWFEFMWCHLEGAYGIRIFREEPLDPITNRD
jgi:hypothetical protein